MRNALIRALETDDNGFCREYLRTRDELIELLGPNIDRNYVHALALEAAQASVSSSALTA